MRTHAEKAAAFRAVHDEEPHETISIELIEFGSNVAASEYGQRA
jgi:hypothetical protein